MDISIQNAASTPSHGRTGAGATVTVTTPGLGPVPGILSAPHVVVLGASIMQGTFGSPINTNPQNFAAQIGFTGTVTSRASSGDKIADTISVATSTKADPAFSATEGSNLYIAHTGGNNVSSSRPHPNGADSMASQFDTLISTVQAGGDTLLLLPLTKRYYGKDGGYADPLSVNPNDPATDVNGSLPYNENVIIPRVVANTPEWVDAQGVPYVDPYRFAEQSGEGITSSDGIHGYGETLGRHILLRLAARARGIAGVASQAGKSFVYNFEREGGMGKGILTLGGLFANRLPLGFDTNYRRVFGAKATDGSIDHFIEIFFAGTATNATLNAYDPVAGPGRLADSRFHNAALMNTGVYWNAGVSSTLRFTRMFPGDTVSLTAAGVRNAGGVRLATYTLTADGVSQALVLDGSNVAASNQIRFAPVVVPASGEISLNIAGTSGFGHGTAFIMDIT